MCGDSDLRRSYLFLLKTDVVTVGENSADCGIVMNTGKINYLFVLDTNISKISVPGDVRTFTIGELARKVPGCHLNCILCILNPD